MSSHATPRDHVDRLYAVRDHMAATTDKDRPDGGGARAAHLAALNWALPWLDSIAVVLMQPENRAMVHELHQERRRQFGTGFIPAADDTRPVLR